MLKSARQTDKDNRGAVTVTSWEWLENTEDGLPSGRQPTYTSGEGSIQGLWAGYSRKGQFPSMLTTNTANITQTKGSECYIAHKDIRWFRKRIIGWETNYSQVFPWRNEDNAPFHGLIAEILLQRTRAEKVASIYEEFVQLFPDAKATSRADKRRIIKVIESLGLPCRAKVIKELSKAIDEQYNGEPPGEYELLVDLPGVGPYSASAFLSLHYGKRAVIIDANIQRLYQRFFGPIILDAISLNKQLMQVGESLTPKYNFRCFNYGLLDVSRTICSRVPAHDDCPLLSRCPACQLP